MSAPGVIASFDGYGVESATIDPGKTSITLVFAYPFATSDFIVETCAVRVGTSIYFPVELARSINALQVALVNATSSLALGMIILNDFSLTAVSFGLSINGMQNN